MSIAESMLERPFNTWIAFGWLSVGTVFQCADLSLWIKQSKSHATQFDPVEKIQSRQIPTQQFVWVRADIAEEIKTAYIAGRLSASNPSPPTKPPDVTLLDRTMEVVDYLLWLTEVAVEAVADCVTGGNWVHRLRQMWATIAPRKTRGPMFSPSLTIELTQDKDNSHV